MRLVDYYLDHLVRGRGRSNRTAYSYGSILETFVRFLSGSSLSSASPETVEAFIQRPRVKRGGGAPSPSTMSLELTVLRGFYAWAVMGKLLAANPAQAALQGGSVKVVERQPDPIDDEDWQSFLRLSWPSMSDDEVVAVSLGFFGGLRRHEVTQLDASQWDRNRVRLTRITRKGGASNDLPFGECLAQLEDELPQLFPKGGSAGIVDTISSLADRREGLSLLPWRKLRGVIDPQTFNRRLRTIQESTGGPEFHPHRLRHSFGTNLLRAGVPIDIVSDLMGHTNINMTMRYAKSGNHRFSSWRKDRLK
jgi:site-specific recombinase XerD